MNFFILFIAIYFYTLTYNTKKMIEIKKMKKKH